MAKFNKRFLKTRLYSKLLILILFFINISITKAQNSNTQNLLIHLSKSKYTLEEVIDFKCHIINSVNHTQEDKNLYIIMADEHKNIILKEKYPILNGGAAGSFIIPKKLESGRYYLGAFTPYLINQKIIKYKEFFIQQTEMISNINENSTFKAFYDNNKIISNIPNSFYVKTEKNNIPIAEKVTLVDRTGFKVKEFFTDANGVAKITFTPLKHQDYSFVINNKKYEAPKPDSTGVNMIVTFVKEIVTFTATKNYKIDKTDDLFTIDAYQNNSKVYTTNFSFENYASVTAGVNVSNLPTGLLVFNLLNKKQQVISSSTVYLKNKKNFEENIFLQNVNLDDKSIFNIDFEKNANKYLSIAVERVEAQDSINLSNFDFFYTKKIEETNNGELIDCFEITNSSQKNTSNPYLILTSNAHTGNDNVISKKLTDDYGVIISGKVMDLTTGHYLKNGSLDFDYIYQDSNYHYNAKVNSDGSFILDSLFFNGKQNIAYKYYNNKNKEINCKINLSVNENEQLVDTLLKNIFTYKLLEKPIIIDTNKENIPTPVLAKEINENEINESSYSTGMYSNGSSSLIDNIKYPPRDGMMNGGNFIKNRINNIAFQGGNIVNTKNFSVATQGFWQVAVVIDEIPATLADLNLLNAADIGVIKFFEPGHVSVSSSSPGGTLAVYTKNRVLNKQSTNNPPSIKSTKEQMLEVVGFSSKINSKNTYESESVIYWNPNIILTSGNNKFSFETNRIKSSSIYKVKILGYNELGKIIDNITLIK